MNAGPEEFGDEPTRRALNACWNECPVQIECLTHALSWPEVHGVWGGTFPGDRKFARSTTEALDRSHRTMRQLGIRIGDDKRVQVSAGRP